MSTPLDRTTYEQDEVRRAALRSARGSRTPPPASSRRPYVRPMKRTWFLSRREFVLYALREFSSVVVGFFTFNLFVGLVCLHRGPDSWQWWVELQTSPFNLILSVFAALMSFVHASTWFQATPKVIRIRRGDRYVADVWVIAQHYVLLLVFAIVVYLWLGGL